ncbi:hypothetical protein EDF54_1023 [Rathayibacter sp. PhB93]|jgi:peptidoglycan hydrolase-like protein with peptidoglycan-binding domain|uniref:peptidoglycan-binding domain-containing protein n=1 Tax=unclassified Rathayibacter TaxID=2609250 RepID=UPI000F46C64A|nr:MULTISPECIES: hypothetical protein [unclassified Rathayibacter]ROQ16142.1 hypothetical protein EDF54_1023 [Rathayibacter sp. PhB93]TDQ16083.1 hypothetical protein EDF17_0768 [Rathayibacter sp. PhB1]
MGDKGGPGLVVLAAVVLAGAGVAIALTVAATPEVPPSVAFPTSAPAEFEPTAQSTVDARAVKIAVEQGAREQLQVRRSGTITALDCVPGTAIDSWGSVLAVDGSRLLSIATVTPLYRDLRVGDTGDDVLALQNELRRLGHAVRADGVLGQTSVKLVDTRLRELGAATEPDVIARESLIWLPSPTAQAAGCSVELGTTVESGAVIAELESPVTAAAVDPVPADLLPGERIALVAEHRLTVDGLGAIRSAEDLRLLRSSAEFERAVRAVGSSAGGSASAPSGSAAGGAATVVLDATLELAEPIETWAVPPAAIYALEGRHGCVLAGGEAVAVEVVASELGKSFVRFASPEPPARISTAPERTGGC